MEPPHLSIGEVLNLLQDEFPDVTISKIRFLESQGLLNPERTPSGYRKFYDDDIVRLRWILRQQRENFLPLKVIKDRLEDHQRTGAPLDQPADLSTTEADSTAEAAPAVSGAAESTAGVGEPATDPGPSALPEPGRAALDAGPSSVSLTAEELLSTCGLSERNLVDLERYGLVVGHVVGRDTLYDGEALVVARLAAGFLRYGVEARHLRMYKVGAEREAGFFEQVVMPMLKQRNPAARQRALTSLADLSQLGDGLRAAMLRQALRAYTHER